jgi:hypothetical protein
VCLEVPYQFLNNNSSNAPSGSEGGLIDTGYTLHERQTGQHIRAQKFVVSSKIQYIRYYSTGLLPGPGGCKTQKTTVFLLKTGEPPLFSSFTKSNHQDNILYSIKKRRFFRVIYHIVRIHGLVDYSSYRVHVAGAGIAGRFFYVQQQNVTMTGYTRQLRFKQSTSFSTERKYICDFFSK